MEVLPFRPEAQPNKVHERGPGVLPPVVRVDVEENPRATNDLVAGVMLC